MPKATAAAVATATHRIHHRTVRAQAIAVLEAALRGVPAAAVAVVEAGVQALPPARARVPVAVEARRPLQAKASHPGAVRVMARAPPGTTPAAIATIQARATVPAVPPPKATQLRPQRTPAASPLIPLPPGRGRRNKADMNLSASRKERAGRHRSLTLGALAVMSPGGRQKLEPRPRQPRRRIVFHHRLCRLRPPALLVGHPTFPMPIYWSLVRPGAIQFSILTPLVHG